ncbi:MAG TPA: universal stress protein [Vicinamibacteria bacterium]|nr:universal stress protein [Vicinamibacteria bacterium]
MFESIVVPVDLTERNRSAVEMAGRLSAPGGRVCLLHVIETIPGMSVDEQSAFYGKLEKRASAHLRELGKMLEEKSVRWTAELAYGPRAKTVLDEAEKLDADLIVIQSHRVGDEVPSEGWGTLSYQIGIFARCSVLLVK